MRPLHIARFWHKVKTVRFGCWGFDTVANSQGYHTFSIDGKNYKAHRVIWELVNGPIPTGLVIDHLCRNRGCVNPGHMETVTPGENTLRGEGPPAQNARRDLCQRGHPFTRDNLKPQRHGYRRCRECSNMRNRRYMAKRRAARIAAGLPGHG